MRKFKFKQNIKAITLTETVVYLALFAVLFTVIIEFAFNVSGLNTKAYSNNDALRTEIFVNEHLDSEVKKAISVDSSNSVFNDNTGVLRLNTETGYVEYKLTDQQLEFFNGTHNNIIVPPNFKVEKFVIEPVLNAESETVALMIEISFSTKNDRVNKTFKTLYSI